MPKRDQVTIAGVPITRWGRHCLTAVVLVAASFYVWIEYGKEAFRDEGEVKMSKLEAAQLIESALHIGEAPLEQYALQGDGVARHYERHHCASVTWPVLDKTTGLTFFRTVWALHPKREAELDVEHELEQLGLSVSAVAAAGFMAGCPGPGPGCCRDPHPPPWDERSDWVGGSVVRITRVFEPGAQYRCWHTQDYDQRTGYWYPVVWRACYH